MTFLRRLRQLIPIALLLAFAWSAHASAGQPGSAMRPLLRLGPQEAPASVADATATAAYGLRKCQVGLSVGSCYDPYQMRKAYQLDGFIARGYDGAGQTIVIVDAFQHPNLQTQVNDFDTYYGLPTVQLSQVAPDGLTPFDPTDPVMVGWAEEISLDVEWAHAMAPGANIVLVLAKTSADSDILSAIRYAVENNLGNVISMSFGANENCVDAATHRAYHKVFAQAARKGITLLASSGDQGASLPSCDGSTWEKAVSSPANDPLVTAVGGTELRAAGFCLPSLGCDPATSPAPGTWQSEIVWNEGPKYGDFPNFFAETAATGGGYSTVFDAPEYQKASMRGLKQRAVPDVAYNAAVLHGVLVLLEIPGLPAGFYRFGGTSAGAPQWAAVVAIANERAGRPLGFLNAGLYQIGRIPALYNGLFHDISSGNNSAIEFNAANDPVDVTGFTAGPGWDATTGLGSPSPGTLAELLMRYVAAGDSDEAASIIAKPSSTPSHGATVKPH